MVQDTGHRPQNEESRIKITRFLDLVSISSVQRSSRTPRDLHIRSTRKKIQSSKPVESSHGFRVAHRDMVLVCVWQPRLRSPSGLPMAYGGCPEFQARRLHRCVVMGRLAGFLSPSHCGHLRTKKSRKRSLIIHRPGSPRLASQGTYTGMTVAADIVGQSGDLHALPASVRQSLTPEEAEPYVYATKWFLVGVATYNLLIWSLKINILFLYQRVVKGLYVERFIKPTMALVLATFVAVIMVLFLSCRPLGRMWTVWPDQGSEWPVSPSGLRASRAPARALSISLSPGWCR